MNLLVKKVENHTENLKYGTIDSASIRNSGDAYITRGGVGRLPILEALIINKLC